MTSLQIFPFTTTVHLFCYVQNFAVMSSLKLEWEQIEISKLNYSVESFSVMGPWNVASHGRQHFQMKSNGCDF